MELVITDFPNKVQVGKKAYYLSNNLFYMGTHFAIRTKVVAEIKKHLIRCGLEDFINYYIDNPPTYPISVFIEVIKPNKTWDLDNSCGFWLKIIMDSIKLKGGGFMPDDNVQYLSGVTVKGGIDKEAKVTFRLIEN